MSITLSNINETISNNFNTLSQKIEATESALSGEIDSTKAELNSAISTTKEELVSTISDTKEELTNKINSVESTLSQRITTNANNISSLSERLDGLASGEGDLRLASDTVVGGIKIGHTSTSTQKAVQLSSSGQAYVQLDYYFEVVGNLD